MIPSRRLGGSLRVLILPWLAACGPSDPPPPPEERPVEVEALGFDEVAAAAGLTFEHHNGAAGEYLYPEMMGSGLALFDYDRDGDLDLYLVTGGPLDGSEGDVRDRLFRNDLLSKGTEQGSLSFTEVTTLSGIHATGYGMGVTVLDADRDGWPDLYLTQLGANQLWRNLGPGADGTVRFEEIGAASGSDLEGWSVPAAVLDLGKDGWPDLFVGQYVEYRPGADPDCRDEIGNRNYCGPLSFPAVPDRLLRNLGPGADGLPRFEEIAAPAGLTTTYGRTLGALAADFDDDGHDDLYVANDGTPNQLWMGLGGDPPRFENRAVLAGVAVNGLGLPEASMGLASADFDDDGDFDLLVTHLDKETNTLYRNDGGALFTDRSDPSGLGPPSLPFTAFGVNFFDLENDGDLDTFTANGAVKVIKELALAGDPFPLHQPNQVFENLGTGTFRDLSAELGAPLALSEVSRGTALGDLDNDGDTDLVILNNGGPVRLLLNRRADGQPWIGAHLLDEREGDAQGARATLQLPDGRTLTRRVDVASSYASSNDPRLHFGLASDAEPPTTVRLEVRWADGHRETFENLAIRTWHTLRRGQGLAKETSP